MQVSSLKVDVDKEHTRWRAAQDNYERQVLVNCLFRLVELPKPLCFMLVNR